MNIYPFFSYIDHTNLSPTATWTDIRILCEQAIRYGAASVCIPPARVSQVKNFVADNMKICTVIGFPHGYNATETKQFETQNALSYGADEIDMVINIGDVQEGNFDKVYEEIVCIRNICKDKTLKVIVETCLLDEAQKIQLCKVVTRAKADYIKTSTGFSTGGANYSDILLFDKYIGENVRIKASGGIRTIKDLVDFVQLGASRIGSSEILKNL